MNRAPSPRHPAPCSGLEGLGALSIGDVGVVHAARPRRYRLRDCAFAWRPKERPLRRTVVANNTVAETLAITNYRFIVNVRLSKPVTVRKTSPHK